MKGAGRSITLWVASVVAVLLESRAAMAVTIHEYPIPTPACIPFSIASGPDGNLWFTENYGARIGRITPSGDVTEFALPGGSSSRDCFRP